MVASKPLAHPPLSEVAFEINFPRQFMVENHIAEYQQAIASEYPSVSDEFILRLPSATSFGKPTRAQQPVAPMRSFVFHNSGATRTVKVSAVNINFLVVDYIDFDDYKRAVQAAVVPAITLFGLRATERIGLRYVNRFQFPAEKGAWAFREYIRSPIVIAEHPDRTLNSFLAEITTQHENKLAARHGDKRLTVRSGLLPQQEPSGAFTYLLDLDCYAEGTVISQETLDSVLDGYHETIESEFQRSFTPKHWEYMSEGSDQ